MKKTVATSTEQCIDTSGNSVLAIVCNCWTFVNGYYKQLKPKQFRLYDENNHAFSPFSFPIALK